MPYPLGHRGYCLYLPKCHLLGSNQGPSDLQSDALPTELKRRLVWVYAKNTLGGARTHDHKVKSLALYRLS